MGVKFITFLSLLCLSISISFMWGYTTATTIQYPVGEAQDKLSPLPRIHKDNITILEDRVILHIPHVQWATFADTKSMDPVLDAGMIGLQIVPQHPNHIHVGDIITYKQDGILIIHRVIDIRHDTQGWYAITQGDNIPTPDPYKVRFEQVHRLLIGVLY